MPSLPDDRRARREIQQLPEMEVFASMLLAVIYRFLVFGTCEDLLTTTDARRELMARMSEACHRLRLVLGGIEPGPDESPLHLINRVADVFDQLHGSTQLKAIWTGLLDEVRADASQELLEYQRRTGRPSKPH
jgi:hypothetical protein